MAIWRVFKNKGKELLPHIVVFCLLFVFYSADGYGRALAPQDEKIRETLSRAMAGEEIVIGTIGGSITQGAGASGASKKWANRVGEWWKDTFPDTRIVLVNAGIGSSTSNEGAHRVRYHLKPYRPDIVIVEFAVNDAGHSTATETMEGLVRQILTFPGNPAVILLFTTTSLLQNNEDAHRIIGEHYRIPMISMKTAFLNKVSNAEIQKEQIRDIYYADDVHPNDAGHQLIADCINAYVEGVYKRRNILPEPVTNNAFEHATILNAELITPVAQNGWYVSGPKGEWFGRFWESNSPGSFLEFEIEGCSFGVLFQEKGGLGLVTAKVDNTPEVKLLPVFAECAGNLTPKLLAKDLPAGKHRIRIETAQSGIADGYQIEIMGILTGGVSDEYEASLNLENYELVIPGSETVINSPNTGLVEKIHDEDEKDCFVNGLF